MKIYALLLFILTAALTVSPRASACINEIGTNHRGERISPISYTGQNLKPYLATRTNKDNLIAWSHRTVAATRKSPSFDNLINLSAVLIRFGKLPEAVKLLQFVEQKYPGNYQTASNIGTAYELLGRNEDALKWIVEGVKRNPEDHFGTEWLHIQILKAKLGQHPTPAPGHSILNLDFGNDAMPIRPAALPFGNDGKQLSLFAVGYALRFQLLERIEFVAAPDPMVAGMLLDWANLELLAGAVETADVLYDAALRYGSSERTLIAARKNEVKRILAQAGTNASPKDGECELCNPPLLRTER
ncbi:hypothetical protein GM658_01070 [Pseudoduganella eburnea]|uniref:Uncharacterized protein n=1 Tax=Massilia eburnea TaxID=1776165 RepID=A0A6L6QAC2_9BURK|nr:hypothetical protein [Massilia eburnea]MTW09180.1 hypothetical protein [Massilia eburnea]